MSSLTVRNLDEAVKKRLRLRAAANGRSMEEEIRLLLAEGASHGLVDYVFYADTSGRELSLILAMLHLPLDVT